ncbi:MAG: hypothetical protein K0V04_26065, partial [Deltaproteobacteria bacterium]|nr:hypothetical protein [Deltaproteobacteria bacterium]
MASVVVASLAVACTPEAEEFNDEAAPLICGYNAQDPDEPFLNPQADASSILPYGGPGCEQQVLNDLDVCPERCDFDEDKARSCLRRLRRADRTGKYDEGTFAPCLSVYDCAEVEDDRQCRITTGCSAGGRGGGAAG